MKIKIFEISVNEGRREADPEAVQTLADSISKVGLLNPITVDQEYTLIAGLHRLEAAKMLGWTEIECNVSSLEGLLAQLAEIDENFVRTKLDPIDSGKLLLKRKEIYESLHPEVKNGGDRKSEEIRTRRARSDRNKAFTADSAGKLGISKRTVEENIQLAKDLTQGAKEIIQTSAEKVKKKDMLKLSRLSPERQEDAARKLVSGEIHSADEYNSTLAEPEGADEQAPETPLEPKPPEPMPEAPVPPASETGYCPTIRDFVADLKDPDKDRQCTPDSFLVTFSYFLQRFCQSMENYTGPEYAAVLPILTREHLDQIHQKMQLVHAALDELYDKIERKAENEAT